MLKALDNVIEQLPFLMNNRSQWSSLIVNRRKPWTFRAFTDRSDEENHSTSPVHTAQTGIRCGRPAGVTVASQKSCDSRSRASAHDHGSSRAGSAVIP
jgi:hypothetical protein